MYIYSVKVVLQVINKNLLITLFENRDIINYTEFNIIFFTLLLLITQINIPLTFLPPK